MMPGVICSPFPRLVGIFVFGENDAYVLLAFVAPVTELGLSDLRKTRPSILAQLPERSTVRRKVSPRRNGTSSSPCPCARCTSSRGGTSTGHRRSGSGRSRRGTTPLKDWQTAPSRVGG
jgi:hypothetical protein